MSPATTFPGCWPAAWARSASCSRYRSSAAAAGRREEPAFCDRRGDGAAANSTSGVAGRCRFRLRPGTMGVLTLRLSGAAAAVAAAQRHLGGEELADGLAAEFWQSLREQTHAFFAGDAPLWRLSLAVGGAAAGASRPDADRVGWRATLAACRRCGALRAAAAKAGGHATLFRADDALKAAVGVFQPLPRRCANSSQSEARLRSARGFQPRPDVSGTMRVR
jgi:hypothetical protein